MKTLATREQSQAIRDRMQSIRNDLPYAVDDAKEDLSQLSDWKFYVRKFPLTTVASVATLAYLAVPASRSRVGRASGSAARSQPRGGAGGRSDDAVPETSESSFVGGLLGAAAGAALRIGVNLAIRQLGESFSRSPQESQHHDRAL